MGSIALASAAPPRTAAAAYSPSAVATPIAAAVPTRSPVRAVRLMSRALIAPTGMANASRYMQQVLPFLQGAQAIGLAASGSTTAAKAATAAASGVAP